MGIPEAYTSCTSCTRSIFQRHADFAGRCPDCAAKGNEVPIPTGTEESTKDSSSGTDAAAAHDTREKITKDAGDSNVIDGEVDDSDQD